MTKTVKWNKIVDYANKYKKYVENNQKELTIKGYTKGELLYLFAQAVKNPGKDVTIPKIFKTCPKCTGNDIYHNFSKTEYEQVANKVLAWFKKETDAPNYVTWGNTGKISVRLANFGFSKIIVFYDNHKQMPKTCWMANAVFYTTTSVSGDLCKKLSSMAGIIIKDYKTLYRAIYLIFRYVYYYEDHQTQSETLSKRSGNCVDLNQILYHALLEIYRSDMVQIVRGTVKCSDGIYGHVWCRIKIGGKWINIDASASARGKEIGTVICASVVSITNINPAWAVNDTGDA